MASFPESEIEQWIRTGEHEKARSALRLWLARRLSREHRFAAAGFALRLNSADEGLRLLHSTVRPKGRKRAEAEPGEIAVYGACLIRIGAINEGKRVVESVSIRDYPRVLLYRAAAAVSVWDYENALTLYRRFLRLRAGDAYFRRVIKLNVAAALVHLGRSLEATPLLSELLHEAVSGKQTYLAASVLELGAQARFLERKYREAIRFLDSPGASIEGGAREALYVRKWKTLCALALEPGAREATEAIRDLRHSALAAGSFETVREIDFWSGVLTRNAASVNRVFFGTSHAAYLAWAKTHLPSGAQLANELEFPLRVGNAPILIDWRTLLASPAATEGDRRVLKTLRSDLYRTARTAEVFEGVFSDQYYDPFSSPERVRKAIQRAREFLSEAVPALEIAHDDRGYRLSARSPLTLRLTARETAEPTRFERLRDAFGDTPFSAAEASKVLALSLRTTQRALQEVEQEGLAERMGASRVSRYRLLAKKART